MPCRDDYDHPSNNYRAQQSEINDLTRMLCTLCRKLGAKGILKDFSDENLQTWWEKHKEEDRRRITEAALRKDAERKRLKKEIEQAQKKLKDLG